MSVLLNITSMLPIKSEIIANMKILCVPQIFDKKAARNVDNGNSKIYQFNFTSVLHYINSFRRYDLFYSYFYIAFTTYGNSPYQILATA